MVGCNSHLTYPAENRQLWHQSSNINLSIATSTWGKATPDNESYFFLSMVLVSFSFVAFSFLGHQLYICLWCIIGMILHLQAYYFQKHFINTNCLVHNNNHSAIFFFCLPTCAFPANTLYMQKRIKPLREPAVSFFVLWYCRNMMVQHGGATRFYIGING